MGSPAIGACLESFFASIGQLPSGSSVSMHFVVSLQELAHKGETTAVADFTMSTALLEHGAVYTGAVLKFRQLLTALPESFLIRLIAAHHGAVIFCHMTMCLVLCLPTFMPSAYVLTARCDIYTKW